MPVKIYSEDSVDVIAEKIYSKFECGDFVSVFGFVEDVLTQTLIVKGEAVMTRIQWLYENDHYGHKGRAREYKFIKGAIGGPVAHKIWTSDKKMIDSEPRVIIWRIQ